MVRVKMSVLVSRREHPKLEVLDEISKLVAVMCVFDSHSRIRSLNELRGIVWQTYSSPILANHLASDAPDLPNLACRRCADAQKGRLQYRISHAKKDERSVLVSLRDNERLCVSTYRLATDLGATCNNKMGIWHNGNSTQKAMLRRSKVSESNINYFLDSGEMLGKKYASNFSISFDNLRSKTWKNWFNLSKKIESPSKTGVETASKMTGNNENCKKMLIDNERYHAKKLKLGHESWIKAEEDGLITKTAAMTDSQDEIVVVPTYYIVENAGLQTATPLQVGLE